MNTVRIAVVGAGWISQIAFLPAVHAVPNARVVALVSGNAQRTRELADFHDIPDVVPYEDFDAYLAAGKVDAVYIATPNSLHADYAIRAARAGCHVLVEKPLATTVAECQAMIDACDAAGVHLMTAYRLHHDPGTVAFLDRIRAGEIGDPRVFTSLFTFQSAPDNHRLKGTHWGGPLQDIGVYSLNAARHIFGAEPIEVIAMSSHGNNDPRWTEVPETTAVTLRFPGGRLAQFVSSFGTDARDTYTVLGTTGTLTADPAFKFDIDLGTTLHRDERIIAQDTAEPVDDFACMIQYFADCIQSGQRPENDGHEGLADVAIMRAIEQAAETGQAQRLDLPSRPSHPDATTLRHLPRTDRRLVF